MNITGFMIEVFVSVLLLITIGYCWILNRRLKGIRADEFALLGTIEELVSATEIADRAIRTLKSTAEKYDERLGGHFANAEGIDQELTKKITEGRNLLSQISHVVSVTGIDINMPQAENAEVKPAAKTSKVTSLSVRERALEAAIRAREQHQASVDADDDVLGENAA